MLACPVVGQARVDHANGAALHVIFNRYNQVIDKEEVNIGIKFGV